MIRASIDLGTNTCLLLVAEWDADLQSVKQILGDFTTLVRLGEGVDQSRALNPQAMERTLNCLREYLKKIESTHLSPNEVICVATSQARDARNGADFFTRVRAETGFQFQILSGGDEAKFTFLGGLLPGMNPSQSIVIDIGGGSTELVSHRGGQSLDVGSVRFTERYLKNDPVTDDEFWQCQEAIDRELVKLCLWREGLPANVELVGVAGTATNLAAWHLQLKKYDRELLDAVTLSRGDIHRMVEELKWRKISERQKLPGIEPNRADVLLAGALILWRSMEVLKFKDLRVSTRGLRFGVLGLD